MISKGSSIPDLNSDQSSFLIRGNVDVDGEMGVDVAHLVLEATGDTDDQVVDDCSDSAEGSDALAVSVVNFHAQDILFWAGERNRDVGEILDQFACTPKPK